MLKREVKEKGREKGKDIHFLIFIIALFVFFSVLFSSILVSATGDVAYILRSKARVNNEILGVFSDMGLSVELIKDSDIFDYNLNDYQFLFIDDVRLMNTRNLPIYNYPSVIMNSYYGDEWGFTDSSGVSKMTANQALSVKFLADQTIKQVYTTNRDDGNFIPYYFLDDADRVSGTSSMARTWVGTGNKFSDVGDVISLIPQGILLENGEISEGKICFYGIAKTNYWTSAAREMFIDCVGFVAVTCYDDSECLDEEVGDSYCSGNSVYQNIEQFHCENPGTVHSQCVDDIDSEFVEECGSDYCEGFGNSYCKDNDIYHSRTCYEQGCSVGECFSNEYEDEQIFQDCVGDEICYFGSCVTIECYKDSECDDSNAYTIDKCIFPATPASFCEHTPLECLTNSDCDDDYYSDNYCSGNNVYHDFHDFSCSGNECNEQITQELVEQCADVCVSGECHEITCSLNSDCGINGFSGWKYCGINENSYEDFTSFTCMNPGTINSYCLNYTLPILREYCDFDCVSGYCIACYNDLSCGTDGFIGEPYCTGDDVYQDYQSFICENPGTDESDCSSVVNPVLKEQCADLCVNGACVDVNCNNNEDCGITGFFGEEFCFNNDIFKNYQNSTCVNPATLESYCIVSQTQKFLIDCGEDYCDSYGNNYCKEDDVYHSRNCYDQGCSLGGCFSNQSQQEVLVENCDYSCVNGSCVGECNTNEDCNNGLFCDGQEVCVNHYCESGNSVNCSVFNILGISRCDNSPDNNPFTFDYREGFTSVCDEDADACTLGEDKITHTCDVSCGAECVDESDCPDKCTAESHKLYEFLGCVDCECDYGGSYSCFVGKCGAECDENTDCSCPADNCSGTTFVDYPDYGICGTSGSEGCLCQTCEAVLIENSTDCGYVEPHCGDGIIQLGLEECDDGNSNDNDDCKNDCTINICGDNILNSGAEECDDGNLNNLDGCSSTCEIESIICDSNADCIGTTPPDYFCKGSERWFEAGSSVCINPGSYNSSCELVFDEFFDKDCGDDYCDDWENYCLGDDVYHSRTCYDKGCSAGACFSNSDLEDEFVKKCDYGCANGECNDTPVYCAEGIISCWKFEGNADDLFGRNDGTFENGAIANDPGKIGNALLLEPTRAHVNVPDSPSLRINGSFSMEAWVKPEYNGIYSYIANIAFFTKMRGFHPDASYNWALNKESSTAMSFWYGTNCAYSNGGCSGSNFGWGSSSPGLITPSAWNHIVVTFDQSSKTISYYINGVNVASSTNVGYIFNPKYNSDPLKIGSWDETSHDAIGRIYSLWDFKGKIDELALYNRTLGSSEISQHYNNGAGIEYCCIAPVP